jgi:hypothetical protein
LAWLDCGKSPYSTNWRGSGSLDRRGVFDPVDTSRSSQKIKLHKIRTNNPIQLDCTAILPAEPVCDPELAASKPVLAVAVLDADCLDDDLVDEALTDADATMFVAEEMRPAVSVSLSIVTPELAGDALEEVLGVEAGELAVPAAGGVLVDFGFFEDEAGDGDLYPTLALVWQNESFIQADSRCSTSYDNSLGSSTSFYPSGNRTTFDDSGLRSSYTRIRINIPSNPL